MTAVAEHRASRETARRVSPGWVPALLVLAATAQVLHHYGVAATAIAAFAAYTLLGNTLPGLLIWRAVQGRSGRLAMDAAFGTTAGFAIELPVYLVAREFGAPAAVLAWPLLTIVLFLAVPRLRRFWRGGGDRLPLGVAWTVAAGFLFTLGLIAVGWYAYNSLTPPHSTTMNVDFPFQFALVGEFKHDVPLDTPWVAGSPLQYHWYVYAHGAAAGRLTGIEPQTLILRLLPLPMIAAFLLIAVALVRRVGGRWWPGNVAVLLILTGVAMTPFAWEDQPAYTGAITDNLIVSPTQTYAALFFIAAVHVLAGILREPRRPAPWLVLTVLLGAVAGAKATFLPMIVCGLLAAVVLRLLFAGRPSFTGRPSFGRRVGPELPVLGITLAWFAFAQFVLYGSGSYGTEVYPLQTIKWTPIGQAVMGAQNAVDDWPAIWALTGLGLLASAFGWAGLAGLFRREWRGDPLVHVMAGFALSGFAGLYLIAHPGVSQIYFARSATPYLAILSALGLAALIPAGPVAAGPVAVGPVGSVPVGLVPVGPVSAGRGLSVRAGVLMMAAAAAVAAAGTFAVQQTIGHDRPDPRFASLALSEAAHPYLWVVLTVAAVAVAVGLAALLSRRARPWAAAAIVLAVLSAAVTSGIAVTGRPLLTAGGLPRHQVGPDPRTAIPAGAITAGRWLRDHSAPRDVVATNSHCRSDIGGCRKRDIWLAAYADWQIVLDGGS